MFRVTNTEDWVPQRCLDASVGRRRQVPIRIVAHRHQRECRCGERGVHDGPRLRRRARRRLEEADVTNAPSFWPSLNYYCCGSPVPLAGTHGNNPKNFRDTMWQHHLGTYRALLRDQIC